MCIRDSNIIMSTEIIGLSHLEREIIANVVRYNIRDFDYDKVQLEGTYQEGTVELDQKGMTILIAKLTAILRLANSMDRSHRGKLADCRMSIRAVSYTHLDVYKRQPTWISAALS